MLDWLLGESFQPFGAHQREGKGASRSAVEHFGALMEQHFQSVYCSGSSRLYGAPQREVPRVISPPGTTRCSAVQVADDGTIKKSLDRRTKFCILYTEARIRLYTNHSYKVTIMSAISRIECVPDLTEQVYQRLLRAICDGELVPGARLTQEELAAALATSRQPVLQALRLLKKDGFVIEAGRRGLQVAPLEPQVIAHVYEVRAVLDGLAARRAAQTRVQLDATVIGEGRTAAAGPHIGPMIDADMRFHHLIYQAAGNPLIVETANQHWHHIRRAMGAVLQTVGVRRVVWDEHEAILRAVNRGDADGAERLAHEHCERAGQHIVAQLTRQVRTRPARPTSQAETA
jgi:DNA-binding GntR family transcriptional regulator